MSSMKIEINLDEQDQINSVLNCLSGMTHGIKGGEISVASHTIKGSEIAAEVSEKEASSSKTTRRKTAPAKEAKAEEKQEETTVEEDEGEEVSFEKLRSLMIKKVDAHRAEIKKKLSELGAANLKTLDKSKYGAWNDFLNTLD